MTKVVILGCGSATGVPTIVGDWGKCDAKNAKNRRTRSGIYFEKQGVKIQIDTSADFREQFIKNRLSVPDAVLYTHAHADHLMGIDDLRGITQKINHSLDIYATKETIAEIKHRFDYVFDNQKHNQITHRPHLANHEVAYFEDFYIKNIKITPFLCAGHSVATTGYCFDNGEVVIIPDFKFIPAQSLAYLQKINVNLLIISLTLLNNGSYHAGKQEVFACIEKIGAKKTVLTHMGVECDYDEVNLIAPKGVVCAYDGMNLKVEEK